MIIPYYIYDSATKRLAAAPKYGTIDGAAVINPTREQYARMDPPAYPLGNSTPPEPREGKVAVLDGYALFNSEWIPQFRYEDAPPPPPRTFSKYKLVRALQTESVWPQIKEWLLSQDGAWDLYLAAEDISEDEPLLAQGIAAVKELLGWTDEKVAQVLASAEIGGV